MFTVFTCACLFGEKVNFELQFSNTPTLDELELRVRNVFQDEHSTRLPRGHPILDFVVARMQIYDDTILRWVDLVTPKQLHHLDQLYVFQPQSQWHIDVQRDLPAPRTPGGRHHLGVPSPKQSLPQESPNGRFAYADPMSPSSIATPVTGTMAPQNTPVVGANSTSKSARELQFSPGSPPRAGAADSGNLSVLEQELANAREAENRLRADLAGAIDNVKRLETAVREARNSEALKAASQATQQSSQEVEVERLRAALKAAETELKDARSHKTQPSAATPPRSAPPASTAAAPSNMNTPQKAAPKSTIPPPAPTASKGMPPAKTMAGSGSTGASAMNAAAPSKGMMAGPKAVPKPAAAPRSSAVVKPKPPIVSTSKDRCSFFDDVVDFFDDVKSKIIDEPNDNVAPPETYHRPNHAQHYTHQNIMANQQEQEDKVHLQDGKPSALVPKRRPAPAAPSPSAAPNQPSIYHDGQQLSDLSQEPSMGPPAPPQRTFKGPGPAAEGEMKAMFEGGLLYRIIDGDTWYFYNDTQKYEMHVTYKFGPDSQITEGDFVQSHRDAEDWIVCELVVLPGETHQLISGRPNGYKSSLGAEPLSAEARENARQSAAATVVSEINVMNGVTCVKDEETALAECVRAGVKFVDPTFEPVAQSLSRPGQDRREMEPTAWKRPTQYLPTDLHPYVTVHRRIEPNDIDQGMLGDCWFLCSVASLAEFPSKVRDIFEHPSSRETARREQALGAYRVTLNKHGWWYVVIVDDYLPVLGDKPCFAKNVEDQTELWVSLLEKAYAKLHGSYAAIAGGDALHALQDLSGYPVSRFDDEEWKEAQESRAKGQELFEMLVRYDESRYLINLNTPGTDDSAYMGGAGAGNSEDFQARYKRAGLGMGHAYSVLQVKNFAQYGLRLVQIRNPWGNGTEWTGAWSDEDPKWNQYPDVAAACGFEPGEDGTFWMAWEDVLRYFDGGGACLTKFNWFDYRVRGQFANGVPDMCFEVTVTEPVEAFLVFSQKDKRAAAGYKYEALLLSVCKSVEDGYMEVDLSSTSDADRPSSDATYCYGRDRAMKYTFVPENGPYLVVPRVYDPSNVEYVLGIISSKRAGRGIEVQFKSMSEDCRLLKNYVGFEYDSRTVQAKSAAYQFNPEVGCPMDCRGPCLSNV